ncbi:double-strand break repair protein AddB [Roseobacter ponti]|uniref:Double-strand break repair protein AddB n=1 Tax=Roseobacter ponti TaxID=1891787 RepID=A0A858SPU2_9RHOB|nr:double-strand break repair protein AddB [Roseobacter ponti]QJF49711.1 double-strand break repair protein AddB [Roseobacter ponti]
MGDAPGTRGLYGLACGVDFPRALVDGLLQRFADAPPEALARITLVVNTTRMRRRLHQLFHEKQALLLPKICLITEPDRIDAAVTLPPAVPPLRRRLELIALVSRLLHSQPDLAPRASLYGLTDSLAALMDEMQGEGVPAEKLAGLDVSDQSGHWQRAQEFIRIAQDYLADTTTLPDSEARQRAMVETLATRWETRPPAHPVIIAGSTGSRGTTLLLMQAVAGLSNGAIVLPGFDFDQPAEVWEQLRDGMVSEDHPQYRFHRLMQMTGQRPSDITPWHDTPPPSPARNALISLSLRPAPVTDAWLSEGPALTGIAKATSGITLLEAPGPRQEALTIAMRLRQAAEEGIAAALITPDRMLTRQVTAALDQWNILPDDSAGSPLHLSPPGRFLRHISRLFHQRLDAAGLLTLLKHPLTHSASARNAHILNTQRLELRIRRDGLPFPDRDGLLRLMHRDMERYEGLGDWVIWVADTFTDRQTPGDHPLPDLVARHLALAEAAARGPGGPDSGELWQKKAGQEARATMQRLTDQARFGSDMSAADYADLSGALLAEGEVRDRDAPHPGIMIWGTLEARVQGADLVILAGLNDGTWPETPAPDPWLNRAMRHKAGLLLPERRIGLAAHDYQQAVGATEVWLTRAIRSDDAETVASRWLNRLGNLLAGLEGNGGVTALEAMRQRGAAWLARADALEKPRPVPAAARPSPRPPRAARPDALSVTEIKRLIRDPYAIYARHVLGLRPLGPLVQSPDHLMRGIVVHDILEQFIKDTLVTPEALTAEHLSHVAQQMLRDGVPWPAERTLWQALLNRTAPGFVTAEIARRARGTPAALEDAATGKLVWQDPPFTLTARADRIDLAPDGAALIYDYKTGSVPSRKQQAQFDKQLLIEAAMIEEGVLGLADPHPVREAVFIGLGSDMKEVAAPLDDEPPAVVLAKLRALIRAYLDPGQGFTARRMMEKDAYGSDYDLLARFGEWDATDAPVPEDLK